MLIVLGFLFVLASITLIATLKIVHDWRMENTYKVMIAPSTPDTAIVSYKNKIIFVGAIADIAERIYNHRFNRGAE